VEPSRIDGLIPPGQARRVGVIPADGMGHARGSRRDDLLRDHGDQAGYYWASVDPIIESCSIEVMASPASRNPNP